jgi:polyisoprenoid-binding protein YceI
MNRSFICAALLVLGAWTASPAENKTLHVRKDGSSMTYKLVHPLHKIEATSKDVRYTVEADPDAKTIRQVTAVVDVMTFDSGNSNRDSHAMEVIDAITFPEANFHGSRIAHHGDSLTVAGTLTFHGVTKEIVAHAIEHWGETNLEVDGEFTVSLSAFNIERPSLLLIPVEDALNFTFSAVFDTH